MLFLNACVHHPHHFYGGEYGGSIHYRSHDVHYDSHHHQKNHHEERHHDRKRH